MLGSCLRALVQDGFVWPFSRERVELLGDWNGALDNLVPRPGNEFTAPFVPEFLARSQVRSITRLAKQLIGLFIKQLHPFCFCSISASDKISKNQNTLFLEVS